MRGTRRNAAFRFISIQRSVCERLDPQRQQSAQPKIRYIDASHRRTSGAADDPREAGLRSNWCSCSSCRGSASHRLEFDWLDLKRMQESLHRCCLRWKAVRSLATYTSEHTSSVLETKRDTTGWIVRPKGGSSSANALQQSA